MVQGSQFSKIRSQMFNIFDIFTFDKNVNTWLVGCATHL